MSIGLQMERHLYGLRNGGPIVQFRKTSNPI